MSLRILPDPGIAHHWDYDYLSQGLAFCTKCHCGEAELLSSCPNIPMDPIESNISKDLYFFIRPGEQTTRPASIAEYNEYIEKINEIETQKLKSKL